MVFLAVADSQLNIQRVQRNAPPNLVKLPITANSQMKSLANQQNTPTYHSHNNVYIIYQVYNQQSNSKKNKNKNDKNDMSRVNTFPERDLMNALHLVHDYLANNSTVTSRAVVAAAANHNEEDTEHVQYEFEAPSTTTRIPPLFRPQRIH